MKEQAYNEIKTKNKIQEHNVEAISRNLRSRYDCEHGSSESIRNQASGEIVSLKISSQTRKLVSSDFRVPTTTNPVFGLDMETGWSVNFEGRVMFRVMKRLKGLKSPFRKLLHNHGNLHEWVNKIRLELDEAQKAIDRDPSSSILREEHAHYLIAFKKA
ncbi:hypothetical protein Tco_0819690 [Tanacetum coccineum]|uniref:Uncharacterized protein n=1 Tax=Tanacetum coccineum TaxID=301880 RepID=A0ABQ5A7A5_9ASTR